MNADPNEKIYVAIVKWINKLNTKKSKSDQDIHEFLDLKDGIILSQLFNHAVQEQFRVDESQLYTVDQCKDNWAYALKNMNLLFDSVQTYSQDCLSHSIEDIEFLQILQENSKPTMLQLVQEKQKDIYLKARVETVLSSILATDAKTEMITAIIQLDEIDQELLSHFVKKLLNSSDENKCTLNTDFDEITRQTTDVFIVDNGKITSYKEEKDQNNRTNSEISIKNGNIDGEKELLNRIDELESELANEKRNFEASGQEIKDLYQRIKFLEETVDKMENSNDKYARQKEEFFNSIGYTSFEEIKIEMTSKTIRISELNKILDEQKTAQNEKAAVFKEELQNMEKRLEKYKNYDKMMELVRTVSDQNKILEKKAAEQEKITEEFRKKNLELQTKLQDKEENMQRKIESNKILEDNLELRELLSQKEEECSQIHADLNESMQVSSKQEDTIKNLTKKIQEISLKGSEKKRPSTPRKNLSSDFNEMVLQLERHEQYRRMHKHPKSEQFQKKILHPDEKSPEQKASQFLEKKKEGEEEGDVKNVNQEDIVNEQEGNRNNGEGQQVEQNKVIDNEGYGGYEGDNNDLVSMEEANQKMQELQESNELLELENEQLREQIKKIQLENAKKASISDSVKQISQLQEEKNNIQERLNATEKKLEEVGKKAEESKQKMEEKQLQERNSFEKQLNTISAECKKLKEIKQTGENNDGEVEKLKKELEKSRKQIQFQKIDYSERKQQMEEEINLLVSLITTNLTQETNDEKSNKQLKGGTVIAASSSSKSIDENLVQK